jgi:hypothetical protein
MTTTLQLIQEDKPAEDLAFAKDSDEEFPQWLATAAVDTMMMRSRSKLHQRGQCNRSIVRGN